jgi:predicted RNase H-like HicB family nuclease
MLTYTAGYKVDPDGVHAEVFDFPGVLTCGSDLAEARAMLADALAGMAEINLEMGEPLPKPDPSRVQPGFDVVEAIRLTISLSAESVPTGAAA